MFIAEREGFEPRVPHGTTVFKTAAIDHSATSPRLLLRIVFLKVGAKVRIIFFICKKKKTFFSAPLWQTE